MASLIELGLVPYLENSSSTSWNEFCAKYESYTKRGGTIKATQLVSPLVQELLSLQLPKLDWTCSSAEFIQEVSALYAPKSTLESLELFKSIKLEKPFSMDAVSAFCMKYIKLKKQ